MRKLVFTASAVRDLQRHRQFIAQDNPHAARRISQQLKTRLEALCEQARLGYVVLDLEEVRKLVLGEYVCRYLLRQQQVIVLRVWHGREDR